MPEERRTSHTTKNNPREIFGWIVYDWANSGFYTTVVAALFGDYLTRLAQAKLGDNGVILALGPFLLTAKSLAPFTVGTSVFLQVFLLPVLGALGDYSVLKKRLMMFFCYAGAGATCLLYFLTPGRHIFGAVVFIVANVCFGASIVFYNSFLPDITTENQRDKVSSRGYAWGYLGGGLLLALNLAFVFTAARIGISTGMAVRLSLLSAGIWWGGFAVITFQRLRVRPAVRGLPPDHNYFTVALAELASTFRELRRLRETFKYLIGYLFYNDGIQTVITVSGVFLGQELFAARGLETPPSFLLGILLVVQFLAFFGALGFERLAQAIGTKRAILVSLIGWIGVVTYAYAFLHTVREAWVLAVFIAIVLGGSQALSRSLFSQMIPSGREASFFGLYEISERGTSWLGPIVFAQVVAYTGSYRQAILSLILFFVVGTVILLLTDTRRAVHDSGNLLPEEAAQKS
ncbi:MAG TPA: MFS transporter [Pyrinomonadaceae bacterium]|nr:MFS transporter [Pyrinomonadaceae bacterium]